MVFNRIELHCNPLYWTNSSQKFPDDMSFLLKKEESIVSPTELSTLLNKKDSILERDDKQMLEIVFKKIEMDTISSVQLPPVDESAPASVEKPPVNENVDNTKVQTICFQFCIMAFFGASRSRISMPG